MSQTQLKPIRVSVKIQLPKRKIWHHLTNPNSIMQWNQASDDWETTKATVDLRVGGRFLSHMQAKDGSSGFDFEGTYTFIKPYHRYDYVMDDGRKVTITIQGVLKTKTVTCMFDPETENSRELQQEGWQAILNSFKNFVLKKKD